MQTLFPRAQGLSEHLRSLRRALHACPEIGFDLPETRRLVREELARLGLAAQDCAGGLLALIGDPARGKTVLLRADMDALPLREQSGLPFAARGDACHACGHDLHAAMLLGAAALLAPAKDTLPGAVKLMFQPAEETAQGARAMIEAGALAGSSVCAAFGIHVAPGQAAGRVNITSGLKTASYDRFAVDFTGQGGHGAMPHNTVDPINAAAHAYIALQSLVSRECAPAEPAVLTIGSFHAGAAGNIIPESARMEGTCRAATAEGRALLKRRLWEICEGTARTLRATARLEWLSEVPPMRNDGALAALAARALKRAGLCVDTNPERLSASEDFALVCERAPTLYLTIGAGRAQDGYAHGNHHPAVRYDESILPAGAAALAACAMGALCQDAPPPPA